MKMPKQDIDESNFLTVGTISKYMGIHKNTVYRYLDSGELPSFRIGLTRRVAKEDFFAWVEALRKQA